MSNGFCHYCGTRFVSDEDQPVAPVVAWRRDVAHVAELLGSALGAVTYAGMDGADAGDVETARDLALAVCRAMDADASCLREHLRDFNPFAPPSDADAGR